MRFTILLKGEPDSPDVVDAMGDPGAVGDPGAMGHAGAMGGYLQDLTRAGILLTSGSFLPSSAGTRIRFSKGRHRVIDGPFDGVGQRDIVAGFVLIDVLSKAAAIEWASRCPVDVALTEGQEVEIEVREVTGMP